MSKAFHHLKGRIKNILRYKNPGLWVIAVSIIIVAAVGIGLAADPKANVLNEPGKSVITDKIDEASESDGSNGSEQTAGSAQLSNSATSTHITVKPEAPEASQVQEPGAGKPEIDYTSDENVTSDGIDKIKLDGYLAEVTVYRIHMLMKFTFGVMLPTMAGLGIRYTFLCLRREITTL